MVVVWKALLKPTVVKRWNAVGVSCISAVLTSLADAT